MGFEFSAVSERGVIFQEVGMLINTKTEGNLPAWWDKTEVMESKKLESFFNDLEIVPFENLSVEELEEVMNEVAEAKT